MEATHTYVSDKIFPHLKGCCESVDLSQLVQHYMASSLRNIIVGSIYTYSDKRTFQVQYGQCYIHGAYFTCV